MENIDTLIHPGWIIPVEPENTVLNQHSIAIHQGQIRAVLPQAEARQKYRATDERELAQHALLPGFVNAHTHASMALLRGYADDLALMDWLQNHIWPAESQWVNEDFVYQGTQLAIAEFIKSGTTCFNEMYFFPDQVAQAAIDASIRACIGLIILDFPTVWANDAEQYLTKGLAVHETFKDERLITTSLAPHAPYTVSDAPLQRIQALADKHHLNIHMHVHETATEVAQSMEQYDKRPLARLAQLGLVSSKLQAVHMTQLTEAEIEQCAQAKLSVIHCPDSNLKLASGFCPVAKLCQAGVNVAIGTDGAASNNNLNMLGELRNAALLAKAVSEDATAVPAHQALQMATLNGAKALGLDNIIGSLLPGKSADMIAIKLADVEMQPIYQVISSIVYTANSEKITDVWVAGKPLMQNRELLTLDEPTLINQAKQWSQKITGHKS